MTTKKQPDLHPLPFLAGLALLVGFLMLAESQSPVQHHPLPGPSDYYAPGPEKEAHYQRTKDQQRTEDHALPQRT